MLIDTDVLIWNLRGNTAAAELLDSAQAVSISAVSWMELVQGVRDASELRALHRALRFWGTTLIHVEDGISARASYLMEEHFLAHSLQMADALIAATALETGLTLVSANDRHYRCIQGLDLQVFRP